jgi:membrane fusion protein (multidrug efflux system)
VAHERAPIEPPQKTHKKPLLLWTTLVFVGVALALLFWYIFFGRFEDSTDDAYVHGNQVRLTPLVPGIVTTINCDDTYLVKEGDVLVRLDETNYRIALDESCAILGETLREVTQMFENVYSLAALYQKRLDELIKLEIDYIDRRAVVASGAVSDEEYITAETNFMVGKDLVEKVKYDLMQAVSLVQHTTVITHPKVEKAKQRVKQAFVNLERCTLRAPATGIVAQRTVQVGESVLPTTPLLAIVPFDQMWVNANFREVDIAKLRIGQEAHIKCDSYGDEVIYRGEVIGIASGSGAVFSPLPPQNATGNWIKIVQRIPVRISIDPRQLERYPLRLGLSMRVHVDVHNKAGSRVPKEYVNRTFYQTSIFENETLMADQVIKEVIKQNVTFDIFLSEEIEMLVRGW